MTSQVEHVIIDDNHVGQRVDNFLLAWFPREVPKSLIYRKIRKGEVRVNKKRVKPRYKLELNDDVRIPPVRTAATPSADLTAEHLADTSRLSQQWQAKLNSAVLYEDDALFVINKPSGLAVHGGSGINIGLIEVLRQMRPELKFIELAHRLDRDTSGCIIIAKKRQALLNLHQQLRDAEIKKCYHAVVAGHWPKNINKVDAPLYKNYLKSGERVVKVDHQLGKPSVTTFQILQKSTDLTLVAAFPKTGRTHQIRVHALHAGCPILGDEKYASRKVNQALMQQYHIKRLCLHAYSLTFMSPGTLQPVTVCAEYDDEFKQLITSL